MAQRHYSKAPILEGVIDLQARFSDDGPNPEALERYRARLERNLPTSAPIEMVQIGVTRQPGDEAWKPVGNGQVVGLRMTSQDSGRVLQVNRNQRKFTYSHMPPYTNWETFSKEAKEYWQVFVEECHPIEVDRYAVRFINRISLPGTAVKLEEYFNLYTVIPDNIPQSVNGMFLQLQMPQADLGENTVAILNLAMADPDKIEAIAITLDIDVFGMNRVGATSTELWERLDQLRERKNALFEGCITDNVRRMIE